MPSLRSKHHARRRELLKRSATVALLGSGTAAMSGKLQLMSAAMAQSSAYANLNDYKSLVCVFLYGGADSFSMFVPTDDDAYARYASSRAELAVPKDSLLNTNGPLGFHPRLARLHELYGDAAGSGDVALVANVGNLIAPITRNAVLNKSPLIPEDLFAHNHQQDQWMKGYSSLPTSVVQSGWGGRMADLLQDANAGSVLPPSFSLFGTSPWLPGNSVQPLGINTNTGLSLMAYLDNNISSLNINRSASHDAVLAQNYEHPLKQQAAATIARAKEGSNQLFAPLDGPQPFDATFPNSKLGAQLRMVTRLIAAREQLNMKRQVFFVASGGWDTHDNQTPRLDGLLTDLDDCLADFHAAMAELNLNDEVTTFTASDFGRTLTINGDGSDHGWGGHHLVMGGAVNGNTVFGELPSFNIGGDDDSGDKGRVIPSMSINQYGALLGNWMGVTPGDINQVFPDLSNFGSDWASGINLFGAG